MPTTTHVNAPTQFLQTHEATYADRRVGSGTGHPLLLLQHFTGTLDNWTLPSPIPSQADARRFCLKMRASADPLAKY
jgi:hypothetical protein